MKRKKLLIISHTEHYKNNTSQIVGWGATINEVNYLADFWEEVVHIGCFYEKKAPKSALPYVKNNIRFVAIPPYGGKSIKDKLMILPKIPKIIKTVLQNIEGSSEVQLRLPTSMGVFLLPVFAFFIKRKFTFWVKYAGNWRQENPPLSYAFQRWFLKNNFANCKVTINGFWSNQPKHCVSFENPCLTKDDIDKGKQIALQKTFQAPFVFAFVGRLEETKGVSRIIDALKIIPQEKIKEVHFVGDGNTIEYYKKKASFLGDKVFFYGFLNKNEVHTILAKSHFFLLPSASEGFPKVIAEACCYGAIPVVSSVGSITHYVNETNGYVWFVDKTLPFSDVLDKTVALDMETLKKTAQNGTHLAELFTFETYRNKLWENVFS